MDPTRTVDRPHCRCVMALVLLEAVDNGVVEHRANTCVAVYFLSDFPCCMYMNSTIHTTAPVFSPLQCTMKMFTVIVGEHYVLFFFKEESLTPSSRRALSV